MIIQTEAVVIRSTKYSDSDCILTLFTRKLGKVAAYSKNSRRLKSPLMGSSQIFSYSNVSLTTRDGRYRLSNADLINNYYKLSSDVQKTYLGYYMLELVEKLSFEGHTNIRMFELLTSSLEELQFNDNYLLQKIIFEMKILEYNGIKPSVIACIGCGTKDSLGNYFSSQEGGRICSSCKDQFKNKKLYDSTTFRLMEHIQRNPMKKVLEAQIASQILEELSRLLDEYIRYHFSEINLKTREFLIL